MGPGRRAFDHSGAALSTHFVIEHVYTGAVRTNIDIDDELLTRAQAVAGTKGKKATVEFALRELVRRKERHKALELRGKVRWEGDLDRSRAGR